ncbi:MAG: MoxR family ATPase [Dehalococcoidales bacterium]|nr:MoxR family ATPase [Dehalococcoidales bacterium]
MDNKKLTEIRNNIEKVIIGKETVIDLILTALLVNGHVLLDDVPGTGKTVLAKSLAKSIQAEFNRIQFTPDLLPSDITGVNYFNQKESCFVLRKGPAFCNILLADEINRATPRTQSSLLECMEERQITIDGDTLPLQQPFLVISTQNPVETAGTYPLPEAQLDRFLMQISMGTPTPEEELAIMHRFLTDAPLELLDPVCTIEELRELQEVYKHIYIHPELMEYIVQIVHATRNSDDIVAGVSPRGTLALLKAVRAYAFIQGRDFVVPEDIKTLCAPVLAHRLVFPRGSLGRVAGTKKIEKILDQIPVPTENWER